jgi:uncharacterized paraquat-inducible protein A
VLCEGCGCETYVIRISREHQKLCLVCYEKLLEEEKKRKEKEKEKEDYERLRR